MQYHLGHGLHNELIQPATAGTTRRMNTVAMTPLPRLLDGNRNCAALAPRQRHRYRGGPLVRPSHDFVGMLTSNDEDVLW